MVLPTRLGRLGTTNPVTQAAKQRDTSCKVTAPLVQQSKDLPMEALEEQTQAKYETCQAGRQAQASTADSLYTTLPNSLQKAVEISKESGASTWLTALPIEEHGFSLHKGAFRDALCLRYGWRPPLLPSYCVCDRHSFACGCTAMDKARAMHVLGMETCMPRRAGVRLASAKLWKEVWATARNLLPK